MKVLLIEDSPEISGQLIEMLGEAGLEPDLAPDASSAKTRFRPGEHQVVLLDLRLQGEMASEPSATRYNGIPLGAHLRQRDATALIVMYSGIIKKNQEADFHFYDECLKAGANHVVSSQWLT